MTVLHPDFANQIKEIAPELYDRINILSYECALSTKNFALRESLTDAFEWANTVEGAEYWSKINNSKFND